MADKIARWLQCRDSGWQCCSFCGVAVRKSAVKWVKASEDKNLNYCPHCGARIGYLPDIRKEPRWISVKDRMPPNADHPGAFCPRYLVNTKYGITEGWYNPDKACWYTLVWFLIGRYDEDDIDIERGDIPKVSKTIEVTHWMPMPEPPNELNR